MWVNLLLVLRDTSINNYLTEIRISSKSNGTQDVCVEVRVSGTPIPEEELEYLFEPDFIGSTQGRGSGMELSICREIVRQHQGCINAEINPDHGTIFKVILPINENKSHLS